LNAVLDALRRLIRVAHVVGGVVIGEFHRDDGALGEKHRLSVGVITLPVEIPVVDPK
jgi:hypothetical protein